MLDLIFPMVSYEEMKKSDKRGYSTLYLYWLENGKSINFDLPLFVSDDGKGVLSVEVFKRVFWAFQFKVGFNCDASIISGTDGNEAKYSVVRISVTNTKFNRTQETSSYIEPKKTDVKRESSKKTNERAQAKKAEETKKIEAQQKALEEDWNKKATKELSKYICAKFKVKTTDLNGIESDILSILNKIK